MNVVVIGAGIFGASTAFHLASAGAAVTIVDPMLSGRATRAGAGIINPWSSLITDPDWYAIARRGAAYYPELIEALSETGHGEIGYRRTGSMNVPGTPEELDAAEARVRGRIVDDPNAGAVSRISAAEARKLFPPLGRDFEALHVSGGARLDGDALARSLVGATVAKGGKLLSNPVSSLIHHAGRVTGVETAEGRFEADAVVLCAGVWSNDLLAPLGLNLDIRLQRGQILHLGLQGVDTSKWPVLLPLNNYYLLAFDDSRVVVGATREEETGMDFRVTAGGQAEVLRAGLAVAPGLATATILETRVGFRPMPKRQAPMFGKHDAVEGLYIGNGLGHSGLTFGAYAGSLLSAVIAGRQTELGLSPYRIV